MQEVKKRGGPECLSRETYLQLRTAAAFTDSATDGDAAAYAHEELQGKTKGGAEPVISSPNTNEKTNLKYNYQFLVFNTYCTVISLKCNCK